MIKQYRDCFEHFSAQLPDDFRMLALRQAAIKAFAAAGIPTSRNEEWKYTRLIPLENTFFQPLSSRVFSNTECAFIATVLPSYLENNYRMVFVDGHYLPAVSHLPSALQMVCCSLQTALQSSASHRSECFANIENSYKGNNPFYALNTAFMSDGMYCRVPENTSVKDPLHLFFISSTKGSASYVRNIIHVEKGADITLTEHYLSTQAQESFTSKVTEIILEQEATLTHSLVNQEAAGGLHIGITEVKQKKGSQFRSHAVAFPQSLVRNDIRVKMLAEAANCHLTGFYFAKGRAHIDFHTAIEHIAPHCQSEACYKGIISDRARAVFNGKILVHVDAQKTQAQLHNDNLLLSRFAEIDTKPELEIYADDVKCSHGATVGQLDENSVFYLQSRGIERDTAKKMLMTAFAQEAIDAVKPAYLASILKEMLVAG